MLNLLLETGKERKKYNLLCKCYKAKKINQDKLEYDNVPNFTFYAKPISGISVTPFNLDNYRQILSGKISLKYIDDVNVEINDKIETDIFKGIVSSKTETATFKNTHFLKKARKTTIIEVNN